MTGTLLVVALLQVAPPNAPLLEVEDMASYEAGRFTMGTPSDLTVGRYGDGWYINQTPAHVVNLSPFSLDREEVTIREYALFLTHACGSACFDARMPIERRDGEFLAYDGWSDLPQTYVDHRSASWFCRWAGKRPAH